jgi:HEAT repeat protein
MGGAAVESVLTFLGDKDAQLRRRAATALGDLGDGRAREPLTQLASTDPDPEVRKAAEEALPKLPPAT